MRRTGSGGTAQAIPHTAFSDRAGGGAFASLSCPSAGNCSAGGNYSQSHHRYEAFVVDETNGTWGSAEEVPSTAALNKGGNAAIYGVSCSSVAHCSAVGDYLDGSGHDQAFVVTRT
jgi:hypothetical protein